MCNGDLSSSIRIHREHRPPLPKVYDEAFFSDLDAFLPHLKRITFLGGEPLLGAEPLRVMERLIELDLSPRCHITTNGTQWNRRIQRIISSLPVHVAISVDGATAATVESIRQGVGFTDLVGNVERYVELCRRTENTTSLAFCLMPQNWHEFGDLLLWADQLDVDVFVNNVTNPAGMSLFHLPDDALRQVEDLELRTVKRQ